MREPWQPQTYRARRNRVVQYWPTLVGALVGFALSLVTLYFLFGWRPW